MSIVGMLVKFCMEIDHKYKYKFCIDYFFMLAVSYKCGEDAELNITADKHV
jgi:hypothetical protein